jgi:hypothetical protein
MAGAGSLLGDMLAHLKHWAAAKGIDFAGCLCSADLHYEAEVLEETPDEPDAAQRHEAEQARVTAEWETKHV